MKTLCLLTAVMVLACAVLPAAAAGHAYPERPVRVFVGLAPGGGAAAEFGAHLRSERDKWARVVKISGVRVD